MSDEVLAHISYDDVVDATPIAGGAHPMRLLWRDGAPPRFEHRCDRSSTGRGVIVCAPSLHPDHVVSGDRSAPTVRASVFCSDCGLHGWITDGRWHG